MRVRLIEVGAAINQRSQPLLGHLDTKSLTLLFYLIESPQF